jgi:hypothetical protein
MVRQQTLFHGVSSVAGAALVGLGMNETACLLGRVLRPIAEQAIEVLMPVVLAGLQASQACGFDQHWFLQSVLQGLLSFGPLVLKMVGAA